jgi:hypothetical protein
MSILVLLLVVTAACGRDDDEPEVGSEDETTTTEGSGSRLAEGGFGDIEEVCWEGEPTPSDQVGVTDTSVAVGTFNDKSFVDRPGLIKEMHDAAVAFAAWCNEHGGIGGRELIVNDRDSAVLEYGPRIIEACEEDFMLVGGGAVLDNADGGGREDCGLAAIPAFVVTPEARTAGLQVQPVPNPVYSINAGAYRRVAELYPDAIKKWAFMTGNLETTIVVRDQSKEAAEGLGYEIVYDREYLAIGETGWRGFVQEMKDAGVLGLEFVGEPENFVTIQQEMATQDWYPEVMLQQTNFYDQIYLDGIGDRAGNTLIRGQYHPFELAEDNAATADYLELMEQYNPEGKVAQLGSQSISAFLLFARAARECETDFTRECMLEAAGAVSDWTGGGLHAPQDPGSDTVSECFLVVKVTADGFEYDEETTDPNDGLYNCVPENVVELEGDFGVPRPS